MDEPGVDPAFVGECSSRFQRVLREVDPGDDSPFARPAQCVEAEVALEVKEAVAAYIRQFLALDRLKPGLAGLEGGDVVECRRHVDWHDLVPMLSVGLEVLLHRNQRFQSAGLANRLKTASRRGPRAPALTLPRFLRVACFAIEGACRRSEWHIN